MKSERYIKCNSCPDIKATPNLYAALRQLRRPPEYASKAETNNANLVLEAKADQPSAGRKLWVDALCINQADLAERLQQVIIMGSIYSQAERVILWLGEAFEECESAFTLIAQAAEKRDA